jgi:RNA polymerase sigma-70 factor, ECF subfamily
MDPQARAELEHDIRSRCQRADFAGAAGIALRGYGPEIFGFLIAFHRSEQDASEVFSAFTERMWRALESFAWESSFRTWAYTIARNASLTYRDEAQRRARVYKPLPEGSQLSKIAEEVRQSTLSYLKSETKSRAARLREALSEEEQMLLALRVDKGLAWNDLVRVLHDGDETLSDEMLKRESARMRKRFQAIKEKLVELGRREGILDGGERGR